MEPITPEDIAVSTGILATLVGAKKKTLLHVRKFDIPLLHMVDSQQVTWLTVTEHNEVYLHVLNLEGVFVRVALVGYAVKLGVDVDELEDIFVNLWKNMAASRLAGLMLPITVYTEDYP